MKRWSVLLLACVAAWVASSGVAWAGEPPPIVPPASHLQGIKGLLGGFMAFRVVLWSTVGLISLMLLAAALSAERVARAERVLRRGRWTAVVVGVISALVLFLAAMGLGAAAKGAGPVLGVLALLVLGFLVWLAVHGLAATAGIVGQRLLNDDEGTQAPWRVVGLGAGVVAGSLLVPLFGWAVFFYLFCRAVGAATLALFSGPEAAPPVAAIVEEAEA